MSVFVIGVPIAGSFFCLVTTSLLYIFVSLALGLLISSVVKTQMVAMLIFAMGLMMLVMLLSGMLFPTENIPVFLQIIGDIIPAKWYILAVFHITDISNNYRKSLKSIEQDKSDLTLEIPVGFEQDLIRNQAVNVMISANAVNGMKGGLGSAYLAGIVAEYNGEILAELMPAGKKTL